MYACCMERTAYLCARYSRYKEQSTYVDSLVETIGLPHSLTGSLFQFHF